MKRRAFELSVLVYALLSWQFSCSFEPRMSAPCGTAATIVQGNGCSFSFQLEDGTLVYPVFEGCEDGYADYRHPGQAGRKVLIGFKERTDLDIGCAAAIPANILCLEDAEAMH